MKILKMIATGLLVLLLAAILLLSWRFFVEGKNSQSMSPGLGVHEGRLKTCPASPNCVSSYAEDETHAIAPLQGDQLTLVKLGQHIASLDGTELVEQKDDYLHITYKSRLFGFVDDLELYFDGSVIQLRSASRVGYSDLGANRKRIQALRAAVSD